MRSVPRGDDIRVGSYIYSKKYKMLGQVIELYPLQAQIIFNFGMSTSCITTVLPLTDLIKQ